MGDMEVTDGSTTYTYQTLCFDMTASAADVEVKIEELRFIDDVTVILDTESTTFRSYSIVLDSYDFSGQFDFVDNVDVSLLTYNAATCGALDDASVGSGFAQQPENAAVLEKLTLTTGATDMVSGSMELRYGFKGDLVKMAWKDTDEEPLLVNIEA